MQGYDHYYLNADIQVGGTDQTFNMQAGRMLLKDLKQKNSFVLAIGFLEGTDGRKMSKSWGNAIWLDDDPNEMFGKIMSVSDEVIPNYFKLATSLPLDEVEKRIKRLKKGENPMNLKKELAIEIVTELYSKSVSEKARKHFESTFQTKSIDIDSLEEIKVKEENITLLDLLVEYSFVSSKTEAKRLTTNGAIEISRIPITDPKTLIHIKNTPEVIKIGKKKFFKLTRKV